jgi:hypothetical protein
MNNAKVLLIIGLILVLLGWFKPDVSSVFPNKNTNVDVMELAAPTDANIKKEADEVVVLLKGYKSGDKRDFKKLRDLYLDLGRLVELDGEDEVITSTEELRQANKLTGVMLRLDIKGKYPDLAKECKDVIVAAVGDDAIKLSKELRPKGVEGFNGLAWSFNEGSK